jgi:UDP-N-acetylglucosamine:LPS N-acetylglucosamine transferase
MNAPRRRVLAVASGGGHWMQLIRLRPAFEGCEVEFASVHPMYAADVPGCRFHRIADANRWNPHRLLLTAARLMWVLLRFRPDVVVTTGAAPGVLALLLARRLGRRTVWVDSIANLEQMSMSGQRARRHADLWLTQWPHLAAADGPQYRGSVL